jgi:hypothetical protein
MGSESRRARKLVSQATEGRMKRKRIKRNPSPRWVLLAFVPFKGREKRMHFNGRKFTTAGKARRFDDSRAAANFGRKLRQKFPVLSKVRLRVEPETAPHFAGFKKNPAGYRSAAEAYARELDQADDLLNSFAGRSAREVLAVKKTPIKAGLVVGKLLGVMYATTRDGQKEKYCHEFRPSSQPLLVANHDGSQIEIVGGQYRFTERGIEDA